MGATGFEARKQTLGFDSEKPWALPALRLLYASPRTYQPLVDAWDKRFPKTREALSRLTDLGFVAYQPPVIVDTRTRTLADKVSRKVTRFRLSNKGRRLLVGARSDIRVLEDTYPKLAERTSQGLLDLLAFFELPEGMSRYGVSVGHAVETSPLPESVTRWWIRRWQEDGLIKELERKLPDVKEAVPGHYRPTKDLSRHLGSVLEAFPAWPSLPSEFRLNRRNYLDDIEPARIGLSGATDYDHDIECQRILGMLLSSGTFQPERPFAVEPRMVLDVDEAARPYIFARQSEGKCFYQPDATYREAGLMLAVLEYERFQNRRDSWNHIERFLGHLFQNTLASEPATLRFVVDSKGRERGYVELIEAFADYALDHPERMPANQVTLAVSSTPRLEAATDPLGTQAWFQVLVPNKLDGADPPRRRGVLHDAASSPYDEYFSPES